MDNIKNIIALDCGNSSFRVILGRYDGEKITTEVISQTPNGMIKIFDYYYWDILKMIDCFKAELKNITGKGIKIDSIGICTWGVDFAPYDKDGNMISNPLSYRNTIGEKYLNVLTEEQKAEMFNETGIICDKINSVYLLNGIKEYFPQIYSVTDKILMVPDIINYILTGVMQNEPSELSTTQLMSSKTKKISQNICDRFSVSASLFSEIGEHGRVIGNILPSIKQEIGINYDIPVICVPSHDTASAVMAIPTQEDQFIFISSGTWSLIGTELDEPIINNDVLESGLTNEVGAFNKITLLRNSAGMFIIQRLKKEYEEETGKKINWEELNQLAEQYNETIPLFNINSNCFFNPSHMGKAIWNYLTKTGQVSGDINWKAIIKAVQESMACCYAQTINTIDSIIGKKLNSIYIVGGGSKNTTVNELTAKRTGKKVVACSKESTSLGNIAAQLKYFEPDITLKGIKNILQNSIETKEFVSDYEDNGIVQRYSDLPCEVSEGC